MATASLGLALNGTSLVGRELTARPDHARITVLNFLTVVVPLLLITGFVQMLGIEGDLNLPRLLWICVGGFFLYAWLPLNLRLPYFLVLNAVVLVVLFDPVTALITLSFGAVLFIVASARVDLRLKVLLLLSIGIYLGSVRAGLTDSFYFYQASGILGGLFMFRTALYVYELRFEKAPVSLWKRVSYFFLLPNLVFQLFPIVDYKTFVRGYYSSPALDIYRKGLYFVAIGVLHLFAYRVIYSYALVPLEDITTLPALLQYVVASYALIVRLSGIFHLCTGIVCLFGFDLPRSFNNYFLASSFSDIWIRINPYWRAFVMKLFYLPLYFRVKHLGLRGLFFTVLLVFAINFFLHSYQWFWVRGDVQITETDVLFWSILGLALAVNSVQAARQRSKPKSRPLGASRSALIHSMKVLATFISMCLLWSLWTSGSIAAVSEVLSQVAAPSSAQYTALVAGLLLLLIVGWAAQLIPTKTGWTLDTPLLSRPLLLIVLFATLTTVLSERGTTTLAAAGLPDLKSLRSEGLNIAEQRRLSQGYYEELIVPNQITSRLWQLDQHREAFEVHNNAQPRRTSTQFSKRENRRHRAVTGMTKAEALELYRQHPLAASWEDLRKLDLIEELNNSLGYQLKPNIDLFLHGTDFTTNAQGIRDRAYLQDKPAGTYRIAQLGGSPELALGTPDELTADNLLEDALSRSGQWGDYDTVEILNFAMGEYTLLEHVAASHYLLPDWQVDAVMIYIHDAKIFRRASKRLAKNIAQGKTLDFPYLQEFADRAGVEAGEEQRQIQKKLNSHADELYFRALRKLVENCEKMNARAIIVYMGVLEDEPKVSARTRAKLLPFLAEQGIPVIDLVDIYKGYDKSSLIVAPWDLHPNAKAQQIVADRLYQEMLNNRHLFLDPPPPRPASNKEFP